MLRREHATPPPKTPRGLPSTLTMAPKGPCDPPPVLVPPWPLCCSRPPEALYQDLPRDPHGILPDLLQVSAQEPLLNEARSEYST